MARPFAEADALEHFPGSLLRQPAAFAADEQRHGDVFQGAEFSEQMMELVYEAEEAVAHRSPLSLVERAQVAAADEDLTAARRIEAAEQIQQGGLARARTADDGDAFAFSDLQGHVFQRFDALGPLLVEFAEPFAADNGFVGFHSGFLFVTQHFGRLHLAAAPGGIQGGGETDRQRRETDQQHFPEIDPGLQM